MFEFWFLVAPLLLLASAFILVPMWRQREDIAVAERDEQNIALYQERIQELADDEAAGRISAEQHQSLTSEVERALIEDAGQAPASPATANSAQGRSVIWGLALLLPLLAVVLYQQWGAMPDWQISQLLKQRDQQHLMAMQQGQPADNRINQELVEQLQQRLQQRPDNVRLRYLLAQTQTQIQDYAGAAEAYRQVLNLYPRDGHLMAEYAQALLASRGTMDQEVRSVAEQALQIEPNSRLALGMLGMDAFQQQNYVKAIRHWQQMVDLSGGQNSDMLVNAIKRAKALLAERGETYEESASGLPDIQVAIQLSGTVQSVPGQTLFVYLQRANGPKMPLAAKRLAVADWPLKVTLGQADLMAMTSIDPSSIGPVKVVARISTTGNAMASDGDWQGFSVPFSLTDVPTSLPVTIDQQRGQATVISAPVVNATAADVFPELTIEVTADSQASIDPGQALFVFVSRVAGPRMPVAVKRLSVDDWPIQVQLNQSDLMTAGSVDIASLGELKVVARVSQSGNAMAQSGDWQGASGDFNLTEIPPLIAVNINQQHR